MGTMRVVVTGTSVLVESAPDSVWKDFLHAVRGAGGENVCDSIDAAEEMGVIAAKDRRILAAEDVCGICAADLARRDAGIELTSDDGATGCIVATTGKHTITREMTTYRRQFMTPQGIFDTRALREATDSGEAHVDPLDLLRGLDNSVLWWLCRYFKIGGVNLQITQARVPDQLALREGWELVREGTCERVLVGGFQTRDQALANLAQHAPGLPDTRGLTGSSVFVMLESLDAAKARSARVRGELTMAPRDAKRARGMSHGGELRVAPAIRGFFDLFACAQGLGPGPEVSLGTADLRAGDLPDLVFSREQP